jgi:hypothetical protein
MDGVWIVAVTTRLELATSGVTGRHSNQLNYATDYLCDYYQNCFTQAGILIPKNFEALLRLVFTPLPQSFPPGRS